NAPGERRSSRSRGRRAPSPGGPGERRRSTSSRPPPRRRAARAWSRDGARRETSRRAPPCLPAGRRRTVPPSIARARDRDPSAAWVSKAGARWVAGEFRPAARGRRRGAGRKAASRSAGGTFGPAAPPSRSREAAAPEPRHEGGDACGVARVCRTENATKGALLDDDLEAEPHCEAEAEAGCPGGRVRQERAGCEEQERGVDRMPDHRVGAAFDDGLCRTHRHDAGPARAERATRADVQDETAGREDEPRARE